VKTWWDIEVPNEAIEFRTTKKVSQRSRRQEPLYGSRYKKQKGADQRRKGSDPRIRNEKGHAQRRPKAHQSDSKKKGGQESP
jgi:hypothetical protein